MKAVQFAQYMTVYFELSLTFFFSIIILITIIHQHHHPWHPNHCHHFFLHAFECLLACTHKCLLPVRIWNRLFLIFISPSSPTSSYFTITFIIIINIAITITVILNSLLPTIIIISYGDDDRRLQRLLYSNYSAREFQPKTICWHSSRTFDSRPPVSGV